MSVRINRFIKNSDFDSSHQVVKRSASIQIPAGRVTNGQIWTATFSVPQGSFVQDVLTSNSIDNNWRTGTFFEVWNNRTPQFEVGEVTLRFYLRRTGLTTFRIAVQAQVIGGGATQSSQPLPAMAIASRMVFSVLPV